jgi:hypothetical protein
MIDACSKLIIPLTAYMDRTPRPFTYHPLQKMNERKEEIDFSHLTEEK